MSVYRIHHYSDAPLTSFLFITRAHLFAPLSLQTVLLATLIFALLGAALSADVDHSNVHRPFHSFIFRRSLLELLEIICESLN
jgi:hypothetical protein